jgi:hypothetical protein
MRTVAIEISLLLFFNEYGVVWTAQFTLFAANARIRLHYFYFFNGIYRQHFFRTKLCTNATPFATVGVNL